MTHQQQPTRTSCGPTCAAMIAGVPVAEMLAQLPSTRMTARRRKVRTHRTNVAEMSRLLRPFGVRLGRRMPGVPTDEALVRVAHEHGRNWHYAVYAAGLVFDPADGGAVDAAHYFESIAIGRLSFWTIDRTRRFQVLHVWNNHPDGLREETREYEATSIGEALTMAERDNAGRPDAPDCYGIAPEDFAAAREEGIAFNDADGLLLDMCPECERSNGPHYRGPCNH